MRMISSSGIFLMIMFPTSINIDLILESIKIGLKEDEFKQKEQFIKSLP
jgi:hypothetical protein